jgi:hypothetical protein
MRRWKRKGDEEDAITFDELEDFEEEDDEGEEGPSGRRYARPLRIARYEDFEVENDGPTFEDLEDKIRSGKYKPKASDPWTAHILYQNLRSLGEI